MGEANSQHTAGAHVVLVPGLWEGPDVFDDTIEILKKEHSLDASVVPSQTTGADAGTFEDTLEAIHAAIRELADQGKEVILAPHSAGGFVASQAMKGQDVHTRGREGKRGGVTQITFITAGTYPEGTPMSTELPFARIAGDRLWCKDPEAIFFNDVSPEMTKIFLPKLSYEPIAGWQGRAVTYCGWKDVPSRYLICENDACLPVAFQQKMAETANAEIKTCSAGHLVMLSQPQVLAKFIAGAM